MSDNKLCTKCKHYSRNLNADQLCFSPKQPHSVVDGSIPDELLPCKIQRCTDWLDTRIYDRCGKEGRWWEVKA